MSKKKRGNQRRNVNRNHNKEEKYSTKDHSDDKLNYEQDYLIDENYYLNFSKAYLANIGINDPFIQNMLLKDSNMNPRKYSKNDIEKMMEDPKRYEKELLEFSQYIENTVLQFKRVVMFFGSILAFDYYLEPTNADEEDMKSTAFLKSYKKALNWIDRFNPKKQFPDIMRQILRQDVVFCYVRESKDNIFLQEMPYDYCKITNRTEYGYQYSFDLTYFLQQGVNIDNFAPEFRDHFNKFLNNKTPNNQYSSWVELDPIQAPCFKFDETVAGIVPPFMGLFPDSIDIDVFREITKTKSELDIFKILLNKIPIHGGDGKTRKANDFALDGDTAGKFSRAMEERSPNKKYVKVMTTPFESEFVDFRRTESGNAEFDHGDKMFFRSVGVNPNVFGGDASTATAINTSLSNASAFVIHMYSVFERFVNIHLKMNTGRYRWKIHFEGTQYDRKDRLERAYKAAGSGFPKSWVAVAMGKTPDELINMSKFEQSLGMMDILIPFQSAHTMSGNDNGRPQSSNVTESGEKTRDADANVR